jgi:hypothetical protein
MTTPKTKKTAPRQDNVAIQLPAMKVQTVEITLIGDSPLICHRWSEKAKKQILDKQMKRAVAAKEAKDPERDYADSLYKDENGDYAFPSVAFKSAAVDACSHVAEITKVEARGAFHVIGEFVKIKGSPSPREDMVRVGMGSADIRYRGEFRQWSARLRLRFNANVLSAEQIINLFNTAGFAIGVGEWRPQKNGSFGMFRVATGREAD